MIHVIVEKAAVNPDALHAALKAALRDVCSGLSYCKGLVTVHLADEASPEQQDRARSIVEAHDASVLTPDQQAAQDRDALPLFALPAAELVDWAGVQDAATFQREMARAFALLRDQVRGTGGA